MNEPKIGTYLDDEERKLSELIESDAYVPEQEPLDTDRAAVLQAIGRASADQLRTKISLRIPNADLLRLKAKAAEEGLPYQTLINSILHNAVS